jgi:hypothetical protein
MLHPYTNPFPGKERDEAVFVFARPYWLAFLGTASIFLFVSLVALSLQVAIASGGISFLTTDRLVNDMAVAILGLFIIFALLIFLTVTLDFYFDIFIVTDRRVVDIDQEQLFYRSIAQLNLEDVEDARSEIRGILQTFFAYGTVTVQTAGERPNFTAHNLKFPTEIATIVNDLSGQAKAEIPPQKRFPHHHVLAVLEEKPYTTFEQLRRAGAITTDDPRRARAQSPTLSPDQIERTTSPADTDQNRDE